MKYRKKPVEIEAVQFIGSNVKEIANFCGEFVDFTPMNNISLDDLSTGEIKIMTLEGVMPASLGDYIIKGVNGEFYPCKPDIFAKTYEVVE